MRVGFVINDIKTEQPHYTTIFLAQSLHNRGHEVYFMGVSDLGYYPEGEMGAKAISAPAKKYKTTETYLAAVQGVNAVIEQIRAPERLDIIMLRNDPSAEGKSRAWAQSAGLVFGQIAVDNGIIVLNDPNSLSHAINKMYFQHFPESVRPRTLISRDREEIKKFFHEQNERIIIKPLQGSGGKGVFMVNEKNSGNLHQMIEAVSRDGYVIAQEFLEGALEGDVRLFVMNGQALTYKGKYAAFKRVHGQDDIRSNIFAGGSAHHAEVDDAMLEIVEIVRPKLIQDGMFLVGLDIVGNKLMEINVFSPGGLVSASRFEEVDFSIPVIEALEKKVYYRKVYNKLLNNNTLAVL